MSGVSVATPITLDEIEGLIKRLGMLGSEHDGEVLNAARFVVRWLAEHQTDWQALLVPEEEIGVTGVVAADEVGPLQSELDAAYQRGLSDGMRAMAAQLKAQAAALGGLGAAAQANWAGAGPGSSAAGLAGGLGGAQQAGVFSQGLTPGAAQAPPRAPPRGNWANGTWQFVCQELLDRHAQGIPGVFRGSREESFVRDVLGRGFPNLTNAQEVWLRDIAGRSGMSW